MMGQDIYMNTKESIDTIEDMKVKLHADNIQMQQTVEELGDNELSIQNNIKKLEVENDKIKAQLKQQQELSGGNIGQVSADQIDQVITVPNPISEKIINLVAKHNSIEDCMAIIKKGFEND